MKRYKFVGTEQDLIDNGFEIIDMLIVRARRDNIVVYLHSKDGKYIDQDKEIHMAYTCNTYSKSDHIYIERNIFYDRYAEKELTSHYAIQDLIEKCLVIEVS